MRNFVVWLADSSEGYLISCILYTSLRIRYTPYMIPNQWPSLITVYFGDELVRGNMLNNLNFKFHYFFNSLTILFSKEGKEERDLAKHPTEHLARLLFKLSILPTSCWVSSVIFCCASSWHIWPHLSNLAWKDCSSRCRIWPFCMDGCWQFFTQFASWESLTEGPSKHFAQHT